MLPLLHRTVMRPLGDLGMRAIILTGFKAPTVHPENFEPAADWLEGSGVIDHFSPREHAVLKAQRMTKQEEIDFSWYSGSLHVVLWALGTVKRMEDPFDEFDVVRYVKLTPPVGSLKALKKAMDLVDHQTLTQQVDMQYYVLLWLTRRGSASSTHPWSESVEKHLEWVNDSSM